MTLSSFEAIKVNRQAKMMLPWLGVVERMLLHFLFIHVDSDVVFSNTFGEEEKKRQLEARDNCLGPRTTRTRTLSHSGHGKTTGGTKFECVGNAHPVKSNTRCYSIGNSFKGPTKIQAPCADGKVMGDADIEAISMRSKLLKASLLVSCVRFDIIHSCIGNIRPRDESPERRPFNYSGAYTYQHRAYQHSRPRRKR